MGPLFAHTSSYILFCDLLAPSDNTEDTLHNLNPNIESSISAMMVAFSYQFNLARRWCTQNPYNHKHFVDILCVSPEVFDTLDRCFRTI